MKKIYFNLFALAILMFSNSFLSNSQCALGPTYTGSVYADAGCGSFKTISNYSPGTYFITPILNGGSYTISTCGAPFDTQISGYNGSLASIFYNDDNGPECASTNASVNYVPNFTGNIYTQISQYNCSSIGSSSINVFLRQNNNLTITSSSASMCAGETRSLTATPTATTALTGAGNPGSFSGAGVSGTTFTAPTPVGASQVYTITYTFGYCTTTQNITVYRQPSTANAGPDQLAICGTSTNLNATAPTYGTGAWTTVSGPGVASTPTSNTSDVTGLSYSTPTVLRWTVSNGSCAISSDDVTLTLDQVAPVANTVSLSDVTTECGVTSLIAPTATDNCSGLITGTNNAVLPITAQGTTVITWTYTDALGNSSSQLQNIVIDDITAPLVVISAGIPDQNAPANNSQMASFFQGDLAQSFVPAQNNICGASIEVSAGAGDVTISLYNNLPNASGILLASGTVTLNGVTTTAMVNWPSVSVTPGVTYYLVFTSTNPNLVVFGDIFNGYPNGIVYANPGYESFPGYDYTFQTLYGCGGISPVNSACAVSSLPVPTVTDNCAGTIDGTTTTTFPIATTTTVVWTFNDGNGNIATANQLVTINDDIAPTPDAVSLNDITAECEVTSLTAPTATDNCNGMVMVSNNASLPITAQGTTVVTWTYSDIDGNSSTQVQNIVIEDVTAPIADVAALADVAASCEVNSLTSPTATDNCGGMVMVSNNASLPITAQGTTVVTWTYTDENGNSSTQVQNVVIDDVTAPLVAGATGIPDQNAPANNSQMASFFQGDLAQSFVPAQNNICGASIEVSAGAGDVTISLYNNLPNASGILLASGTVTLNGVTTTAMVNWPSVSVTPGVTYYLVFTSTNPNLVISGDIFNGYPNGIVYANAGYVSFPGYDYTFQTLYGCGGISSVNSVCAVSSLPAPTATDNCAGTIDGTTTTTFPIASTTTVVWTFNDGNGNIATANQLVTINDDIAPTPDAVSLNDITAECEITSLTAPTATDNCGGMVIVSNNAILPITGQGTTVVTWTYSDMNGNSSTQLQNIVIDDVTAPLVAGATGITDQNSPANNVCMAFFDQVGLAQSFVPVQNNICGASIEVSAGAGDVTISLYNNLPNASGILLASGTVTLNGVTTTAMVNWPSVSVTPGVTYYLVFTSNNPNLCVSGDIFNGYPNGIVYANAGYESFPEYDYTFQTFYGCGGISPVNSACAVSSLPVPTVTDNCAGTIDGTTTTTFPIATTTTVVWTFNDGNGNIATSNQLVTINDDIAPTPDAVSLNDITAECEVTSLTAPTATDNCNGMVMVSNNASLPITAQGTTVVTWTYTDMDGNSSTQVQNIVIDDVTAPIADVAALANVTATCEVNSLTSPTATDNCGSVIVSNDAVFPITSDATVTWTYTDENGNSSSQTQEVLISAVDATTTTNGATITANNTNTGVTYQWVDCDNANAPIAGETGVSFTALVNGNYAVEVTEGSCTETSACVAIDLSSITEITSYLIKVYPNPTSSIVNIVSSTEGIVSFYDVNGKLILTENVVAGTNELNVDHIACGTYTLRLTSVNGIQSIRLIITE